MSLHASRLASPEEVRALLADVSGVRRLPDRLRALSGALLGRPYLAFPLVGDRTQPETFVSRLDGFDCVTYAETVLALAWSRRPEDLPRRLVSIRYFNGRIRWMDRNHYWTTWIRRNVRAGHVDPVLPRAWVWANEPTRELNVVQGYPTHHWRPRYLPSTAIGALAEVAAAGDVVGFVSNKPNLDTFHVGLLMPDDHGGPLGLRHAGRSAGQVVHQDLSEFLRTNDVPGILIVRPLDLAAYKPPRSSK